MKVKIFLTLVQLVWIIGCSPAPEGLSSAPNLYPQHKDIQEKAIWVATTADYQTGFLHRLDIKNGKMSPQVLSTAGDIALLPDDGDKVFLLTRSDSDSIQTLSYDGSHPQISEAPLPQGYNPQGASRDSQGRIWVSGFGSNEVHVFSPDLRTLLKTIDLSPLKDSFDPYAELSSIFPLPGGKMGVVALRLRRKFLGVHWIPEEESGLAVIDELTLTLQQKNFLPVANPLAAYLLPNSQLLMMGAGDLSPHKKAPAKKAVFSLQSPSAGEMNFALNSPETQVFSEKILDSSLSAEHQLAFIVWDEKNKKSCVHYGEKILTCQFNEEVNGYLFTKILVAGPTAFVAFQNSQEGVSELWAIPLDGGTISKITMEQTIVGLATGP